MKTLIQLAVTIFGALTIPVLQAQTVEMRVDIPFDFNAGKTSLPAGLYIVESKGPVVMLHTLNGAPQGVFVMTKLDEKKPVGDIRLGFHQYGNEYFLAAIRDPSNGIARVVRVTPREREIARRLGGSLQATVMAAKRQKGAGKP